MKRQILLVTLAAIIAVPSGLAASNAQLKAVKKSINSVPVPELAALGAAPQAKADINSSVRKGVYGSSSSSTVASLADGSQGESGAAESSLTARGSARTVHGGQVNQNDRPIHERRGNGRFPISPPHGRNPPGHDPDHNGRPDFVDYTKPRSF